MVEILVSRDRYALAPNPSSIAGLVMKTIAIALSTLLASLPAFAIDPPACFLGRWKSDEALTLADMNKHPEVTEKARALFENKFFGRLVLINGSRNSGTYFEDISSPQEIIFTPYAVIQRGEDWVTLRHKILGIDSESKWFCEGTRIYALVTKWEFREYFSPIP